MYEILSPDLRKTKYVKRSNMKQKLLWEADVSELIQELLKRKSDRGESYFQLEVTQYENQKQRNEKRKNKINRH